MNDKLQKIVEQATPFFIIGLGIAIMVALFIMLSYVVVWGLIIGAVLWLVFWLKEYFTAKEKPKKSKGRVIEHDDK